MIDRLHHRGGHYALLVGISLFMFFLNLGGAALWDVDEGRNTTCAYEMWMAGNWIVPTFNGALRVDKPALLYWLQILAYGLFGVTEFAGRFPSAMAALGTVLLSYELARSMFTRTTGLIAGVVVATTPMLCGAARFANPDALLNFCIVLTLSAFWLGLKERRWWWYVSIGIGMGLGMLAKGPVGAVLPSAIIAMFLMWEGRWRILFDWRWIITWSCFALVGLPWYVWVGLETHGEFLNGFFVRHNLERGMSAMENHRGFPGYYLVVLILGTAPWSIFLGVSWWYGFWSAIRNPWARWQTWWTSAAESPAGPGPADTPAAYRLLTIWIAVFLVFFSIAATKLPNYVLPTIVPCAVMMARFLQRWRTGMLQAPSWLGFACVSNLLVIGLVAGLGLVALGGVGQTGMLRGRFVPGTEVWAILGLGPVIAAGACWYFARSRQLGAVITATAVAAVVLFVPLAAFGSALFNRYKAPQPLTEFAELVRLDEDIRIGCWRVDHLPSLNFYVKRNVEHLPDENAVASFLQSRLHVFVLMPQGDWERLEKKVGVGTRVLGRQYDMYHHDDIVVVTNR